MLIDLREEVAERR